MASLKVGLWSLLLLASGQAFGSQDNQLTHVRVKFLTLAFPIAIEGEGISVRGVRSPNITDVAIPKLQKLEIDLKDIGQHKVWFIRKEDRTERLNQKYIEITASSAKIKLSGFEVPTPLLISPRGEIISSIPIDTYLEGVLAGEMPLNWPMEALKAQVIAARTYTLFQIRKREKESYHVQAGILDQAYSTAISASQRERIQVALSSTSNLVMTRHGEIIKAYYHADCGGQTEDPDYVWGKGTKKRDLQSVSDVQCALNSQSKWSIEIPLDEILEKLDSHWGSLSDITGVRVASKTPSGRVALLAFNDSHGKNIFISGNDLRSAVGFMRLKSTIFEVQKKEDSLVFSGRGFGHGSGLCQLGSKFLAEKGLRFRDILKHYYPSISFSELHVADR